MEEVKKKNCTFRHMVGEIYKERKKLHFQIYKWKLASENMMAVAKGEMCQSGASVYISDIILIFFLMELKKFITIIKYFLTVK